MTIYFMDKLKTVVIIGGNKCIGLNITQHYLNNNYNVVVEEDHQLKLEIIKIYFFIK